MRTSKQWFDYFNHNLTIERINWQQYPTVTEQELTPILQSLQAWQLGETSDGSNLLRAGNIYADRIGDKFYVKALQLFIKEEQKHGENLGKYLDLIGEPRIKKNIGDSMFRKVRHLNTSMESWTLAVITVESAAQIFYQSLKDATKCALLKEICTDILIDEAPHVQFQHERLLRIYKSKSAFSMKCSYHFYRLFFFSTTLVIWLSHRKLFIAGNNNFKKYWQKMSLKFEKTIGKLKYETNDIQVFQIC